MRASPFSVHGDRANAIETVFSFGERILVVENRMDQFLDWTHETTDAWLP